MSDINKICTHIIPLALAQGSYPLDKWKRLIREQDKTICNKI